MNVRVLLLISVLFCFCNSKHQVKNDKLTNYAEVGNKKIWISQDTALLGKLIYIKMDKPLSVKFKYVFIDNSAKAILDVPGPSDAYLEALLRYDSSTFKRMMDNTR